MKTVYFVRHGESENNAGDRYNTPQTALSEEGKKQATHLAKRCANLPIEFVVASPLVRAAQTAETIGKKLGKKVEYSELFRERRLPSRLIGAARIEPDVIKAMHSIIENFTVPGYRYEDGENFEDLKERALAGLSYLESRPEQHILVVSHGLFMCVLAATVLFGPDLSGADCQRVLASLKVMQNTAISVFGFEKGVAHPEGPKSEWRLRIWNDHAHLG